MGPEQDQVEESLDLDSAEIGGTLAPVSHRAVSAPAVVEPEVGPMDPYATQKGLIVLFGGLAVVVVALWGSGILGVPGDTGVAECTRACESMGAVVGSFEGGHCSCLTP